MEISLVTSTTGKHYPGKISWVCIGIYARSLLSTTWVCIGICKIPVINNNVVMEIRPDSRESLQNKFYITWWRHDVKMVCICDGNPLVVSLHHDVITIDTALVYKWIKVMMALPHILALTHWGWDQMDAISQMTSSRTFSRMKLFEFRLKFQWSLSLRVQLTIFQPWVR